MSNNQKRYMKFTQNSGCILAEYNSISDGDNSILVINNNSESGVYNKEKTMKNSDSEFQC